MTEDLPRLLASGSSQKSAVLDLIRRNFAFMDDRINPPSSMHRLTEKSIEEHSASGEIWTIGEPVCACIFLKVKKDAIYIGKLTVDSNKRGRGLARRLVMHAEARAREKDLGALELETRIELTENHAAFARLGFAKVSDGTHPGFDKPTFMFRRKWL